MVFVAVSDVYHAEGNEERASDEVVEPTVMAAPTRAGERVQASTPYSFPAATATVTPELMRLLTAVSIEDEAPPPTLMLATAGRTRLAVTQLTPAMMFDVEVVLAHWKTLTPRSIALLATP